MVCSCVALPTQHICMSMVTRDNLGIPNGLQGYFLGCRLIRSLIEGLELGGPFAFITLAQNKMENQTGNGIKNLTETEKLRQ